MRDSTNGVDMGCIKSEVLMGSCLSVKIFSPACHGKQRVPSRNNNTRYLACRAIQVLVSSPDPVTKLNSLTAASEMPQSNVEPLS